MLESVFIKSLFGLYTYNLDIKPPKNNAICFITGPNGYGKTTILNMLNSLYLGQMRNLTEIPFDVFRLHFDDGHIVDIEQKRNYKLDDNIDEKILSNVGLNIRFCKNTLDNKIQSIEWNNSETFDDFEKLANDVIQLYFASHPTYYIRDSRLGKNETTKTVMTNANEMRTLLTEASTRIKEAFLIESFSSSDYISEEEYNSIRESYKEDVKLMLEFGLIKADPLIPFDRKNATYLKVLSDKLINCIKLEQVFFNKLRCFQRIIDKSDFANKRMQLNPSYGYRFIANNEELTILFPDTLSSGEQHTLIMAFDLLFKAYDASLVLIDEPELSFHITWQMNFLDNLREITTLRNLQCIVSTHSPLVFNCDFDLAEDLYKQSKTIKSD